MTAGLPADLPPSRFTVGARVRDERRTWRRVYLPTLLLTLICGAWASLTAPRPLVVTLLLYLAVGGWILLRPVVGLYAVTFFTLLGDADRSLESAARQRQNMSGSWTTAPPKRAAASMKKRQPGAMLVRDVR